MSKYVVGNSVGIWDALCKAMAELLYCEAAPPKKVGISSTREACRLLDVSAADTRETLFGEPLVVRRPDRDEANGLQPCGNRFQQALSDWDVGNEQVFTARRDAQLPKLLATLDGAILGTIRCAVKFGYDGASEGGDAAPSWFEKPGADDPGDAVFITKRALFTDLHAKKNPLRGMSGWLHVTHGRVVIFLIPPHMLVQDGDLSQFFKKAKLGDLSDIQGLVLERGDSVWLPLGFTPIWIGVPNNPEFRNENPKLVARGKPVSRPGAKKAKVASVPLFDECVSVAFVPVFEPTRMTADTTEQAISVRRWLQAHAISCPLMPPVIAATKYYTDWMAAVPVPAAAAPTP